MAAFDEDTFEFEFELLNSEDEKIITLVCKVDRPLDPLEYAEALRAYAERIESILTMSDLSSGRLN